MNEQVFFLSVGEVTNEAYGFKTYLTSSTTRVGKYSNRDAPWLLRSAHTRGPATQVAQGGAVLTAYLNAKYAARPAFNLDKSAVLFISAAVNGKTSNAEGALQAVADHTAVTEWKLTLKDSARSAFTASLNAASSADVTPGGSVLIDYSGAVTGSREYISAMIVNSSEKVLYYGNIANAAARATAQAITIPAGLAEGGYTLKIFNEQCNGDKRTDYASAFQSINITVTDTTPPTLTAGAVERTSDTAATVKFTSNEAGQYYYGIVKKDALPPTIHTSGTGAPCDTIEQTITPTLTAGAKDIYIVVKDAAGNESNNAFKITIPAYVPPDTTPPILTTGAVERTSDSFATVKFTSNEAGQYYYTIVDKDAPAPTIYTAGRGTPCGTTEQTISAMFMAGAKDIYIIVKDAAGNVSLPFKIIIPAYVPPDPSHTHSWAAAWTSNDTHHWHECVGTGTCNITVNSAKSSYGEHRYDNDADMICHDCLYDRTPPTVTSVTVAPATASVEKGGSKAFTATVTGTNSPAQTVIWDVKGETSASTTISNGALTVGSDEASTSLTVKATSTVDTSKSGSATVTVTASPIPPGPDPRQYQITEGQYGVWTQGSTGGLRFTANGDYGKFRSVSVDGPTILSDQYTVQSGSTIVTLKASYLETLTVGRHTLRVNFTDGFAQTTFTVNGRIAIPKTGDSATPALWLGIMLLAGAVWTASVVIRRKRQNG